MKAQMEDYPALFRAAIAQFGTHQSTARALDLSQGSLSQFLSGARIPRADTVARVRQLINAPEAPTVAFLPPQPAPTPAPVCTLMERITGIGDTQIDRLNKLLFEHKLVPEHVRKKAIKAIRDWEKGRAP